MSGLPPALGEWRVDTGDCLGRGGYSAVYACRRGDTDAAIKVFNDATYLNTFEHEVNMLKAVAGIEGLPRLLDWGRDAEGRLCLVTDRLPGRRLDERVRLDGPLPVGEVLALLRQLLRILAAVHARGLAHLDLKVSNVLWGEEGVSLIDWGCARPVAGGRLENLQANRDYVAPECFYGELSAAADAYSLGWLAVFALSGLRPFHFDVVRDPAYRALAHCCERPLVPTDMPQPLRSLVLAWLRKNPGQRPMHTELDVLLQGADGRDEDNLGYASLAQLNYDAGYARSAAERGIPWARYQYALQMLSGGQEQQARYWLGEAAEQGFALAASKLAQRLLHEDARRHGPEIDSLLQQACEAGDARGLYLQARRLLPDEPERARAFLERAASRGYRRALHRLAILGLEAESDDPQAILWLRMAAARGHRRSRRLCRERGLGW